MLKSLGSWQGNHTALLASALCGSVRFHRTAAVQASLRTGKLVQPASRSTHLPLPKGMEDLLNLPCHCPLNFSEAQRNHGLPARHKKVPAVCCPTRTAYKLVMGKEQGARALARADRKLSSVTYRCGRSLSASCGRTACVIFYAMQTRSCCPCRTSGPVCTLRPMTGQMRRPTKVRFPLLAAAGRFCAFRCLSRNCATLPVEGALADAEYACLAAGRSCAYGWPSGLRLP